MIHPLIEMYNAAKEAIYEHVGFPGEDWGYCPIDDCTAYYWTLVDDTTVYYADTEQELEDQEGNYYSAEVYTQRFYDKYVYRGQDLTMIFLNPGVDGMRYFSLFDNSKERQ